MYVGKHADVCLLVAPEKQKKILSFGWRAICCGWNKDSKDVPQAKSVTRVAWTVKANWCSFLSNEIIMYRYFLYIAVEEMRPTSWVKALDP